MAIIKDNEILYAGAVLKVYTHCWMDGMLDEYALVWDAEDTCTKSIQVGYYGCDGQNLMGSISAMPDATKETKCQLYKSLKPAAIEAYGWSVLKAKNTIKEGSNVVVVRGRKVKQGTRLQVFWVGEKETYFSQCHPWLHETEEIAGCYDEDGNKIWIKAEYLKVIDTIKSPNSKERKKFIKAYILNKMLEYLS